MDGDVFGDDRTVDDERGHFALGVDLQVLGAELLVAKQIDVLRRVADRLLRQGDEHLLGADRVVVAVDLEHDVPSSWCARR